MSDSFCELDLWPMLATHLRLEPHILKISLGFGSDTCDYDCRNHACVELLVDRGDNIDIGRD